MSKKAKYHDKYAKTNRTFPVGNTILLVILIAAQIGLIFLGFSYQPQPQDLIQQYNVTVEPLADGSLDITYELVWQALDDSEELTWVEIGMANKEFTVYPDSVSSTIDSYSKYEDGDYVSLQLDFKIPYIDGEIVNFSFKINQKDMLCRNDRGYFYEFVPGWFNSIQVKNYRFTWRMEDGADRVREGSLDYGGYEELFVQYDADAFTGCQTIEYEPFYHGEAYNGLESDKTSVVFVCCVVAALLILAEVYIIDSYVSYNRGRGVLTGYGHHIHTYGRSNPHYINAREKHLAQNRSSGGRSGGCACACACACAGGGRAGCSQKDTYGNDQ